jgi:hypothetical protein
MGPSTVDGWAPWPAADLSPQYTLMMASLEVAVPLWQERLLDYGEGGRRIRSRVCVDALACRGDILQYGIPGGGRKNDGRVGDVFNRLAEGIALGSFQPGGVRMFGRHWEYGPPGEGTPPGAGWEDDVDQLAAQAEAQREAS